MKPEEKAKELVNRLTEYADFGGYYIDVEYICGDDTTRRENAKKCAFICVDEIIKSRPRNPQPFNDVDFYKHSADIVVKKYWEDVKQEINKL